jgi:hypothetical protein
MPTGAEPTLGAGEATEGSDDPSPSGPPNGMDLDDSGDAVVGAAVDGGVDDVGTGDVTGPVGQDDGGP